MKAHFRKHQAAPDHEYADRHVLLRAREEHVRSRRRLRLAADLVSSGETACNRLREFLWDLGEDLGWQRWKAEVARQTGIPPTTAGQIIRGQVTTITTHTVDKVARISGIPVRYFYDSEQ